jgi:ABC-type transport system involved in multi-copper enzyme maturation permease subunit
MEMQGEDMARFGLIFLLSLLYISTFFTLGLMISTLTHRSSTALLVSLLVWICWILVVPNLAPIAARLAAPVPGRQVIEAEKQAIDRESQLLMAGIGKRKVYGDQQESERIQKDGEKKKRKLEEFYQDKMSRQIAYSKNLARLSPSASYLFAATRLAGTGPNLFDYFQKALERFHQGHEEFRQSMWSMREWSESGPQIKDPDWFDPENLPRFDMFAESLTDSFDAALFDILLLAVFNVLFFMLSYTIFLRYDVT